MIQEIYPHKFDNSYKSIKPTTGAFIVIVKDNAVLLRENNKNYSFPVYEEIINKEVDLVYLFSIDNVPYFYMNKTEQHFSNCKFVIASHRNLISPQIISFAAITAVQIIRWYNSNIYCGVCGSKYKHSKNERMLYCSNCNNMIYPKISPAVIVGLINGDKICLTKYAGSSTKNYALIAGFAEVGETIEETVKREVFEEVGLKVKNITYYKSQPWSYTDTLLFGFFCELNGNDKINMDENELSVAKWIARKDIKEIPNNVSLTNEMIIQFKNNKY